MLGYLQLLRPFNCLMAAIAVFIGGLIVAGTAAFSPPMYLAMLAAFLITGAGNAINDYTDVNADRINKPKRPIITGKVSRNSALIFSVVLFIVAIFLAGMINFITFGIAIINSILLIVYSIYLQNKILMGNITVSYLVGSSFLFGGAAMGNLLIPVILMLLSAFANLSREIVKDLEDLEGDRKSFMKRLVNKAKISITERFGITTRGVKLKQGKSTLTTVAFVSLLLAVIISPLPYIIGTFGRAYLVILVPTDIAFLLAAYNIIKPGHRKFSSISKQIKIGMFLGLIAFIMGALI